LTADTVKGKQTVSAPLVRTRILPSGVLIMVLIRFLVELNSITNKILYVLSSFKIRRVISYNDYFIIVTPIYLAALSNESSSGLEAR
jgi:hypothetical protein